MTSLGPRSGIALRGLVALAPGPALDDEALRARLAELGATDAELERRSGAAHGVEARHWIEPGASVEELAARAGAEALERARIAASDVDLLVVATSTPPRATSSLAGAVARSLGTRGAAHDLRAGGAGGLVAWLDACAWIGAGAESALVIAVETPSRFLSPRSAGAFLYGDGAAALVLAAERGAASGLLGARLALRPLAGRAFTVPGTLPPTGAALERGEHRFQDPDREYLAALDAAWEGAAEELRALLDALGASAAARLAPYAVSGRQLARLASALAVEPARLDAARACLARRGCLGAAGPLTVLAAELAQRASTDAPIACLALGGGGHVAMLAWRTA